MPGRRRPHPSTPCPSPGPRSYLRFLKVKGTHPHSLAIASPELWGCYTFWDGERSRYCPDPLRVPEAGQHYARPRWTGYLIVYQWGLRGPAILAISADTYLDCPFLRPTAGPLRKRVIEVSRLTEQPNAPLRIANTFTEFPGDGVAVEHVTVYLGRLWGIELSAEGGV